jgi:hypothetical protein
MLMLRVGVVGASCCMQYICGRGSCERRRGIPVRYSRERGNNGGVDNVKNSSCTLLGEEVEGWLIGYFNIFVRKGAI